VFAALFRSPHEAFVGRGTGVTDAALARKQRVVEQAVHRLGTEARPHEILRRVGGREIVALLGAMSHGLARRMVVLIDGFVVTAAAAVLLELNPEALAGLVFTHRSDERAHGHVLERLGVNPLIDLGFRLGEASGALAAFPLLELACVLHAEMASFESAGVPERLHD
jgi:nicotinate-nucleotide--dimethylbenzimidazole phosphoribosyltransferase